MYVATIIANNNSDENVFRQIKADLPKDVKMQMVNNHSVDFFYNQKDLLNGEIRKQLSDKYKIDIITQKSPKIVKKLLVCDMESTIIENEFLDEIADLINIKQEVALITEKAMNGEINFENALKERVDLIKNLPQSEITNMLKTRLKYNPGAKELIAACHKAGICTMLVSGGFTIFTDHIAKELGFDESHANQLVFENEKLKGVREPILGKEAKLKLLKDKAKALGISLAETMAIGDGANDLPMLHGAGLGIAYKAKAKVRNEIENQINYSSLMAAAYANDIA